jgi:cation diffusion facilitator family transporter
MRPHDEDRTVHGFEHHVHRHDFLSNDHDRNSRRVWLVVALTGATMLAEIVAGTLFGSMALLADGWHMGTHLVALTVSGLAYWTARRYADDPRFTFGTGKVGDLVAFASAIGLGLTSVLIAAEAFERLAAPRPIAFREALAVALVGLAVNLASAWLLRGSHHHHYDHAQEHGHAHDHGEDHNLRAAYIHVVADALTSVLAMVALLAGARFGWNWLDPAVALLGAAVIAVWAWGLGKRTALALLDADAPAELRQEIVCAIEREEARISDLHLWRLAPGRYGLILSLVSHGP